MTFVDHRSIPVEVLRDFGRTRNELISIHAAAREAGIGKSTLHAFISGRTDTPHPRVRRLLALWYLEKRGEPPDAEIVRPYASALSVLVGELPETDQDPTRARLIQELHTSHEAAGPIPRWLRVLMRDTRSPEHQVPKKAQPPVMDERKLEG